MRSCKHIAIASDDQDVLDKAAVFIKSYVIPVASINPVVNKEENKDGFVNGYYKDQQVKTFKSLEDMEAFQARGKDDFCLGLYFKKVDKVNFDYEVYSMKGRWESPDTNMAAVNSIISTPNIDNFKTWHNTIWAYPIITEFLARYQVGADMTDKTPFFNQEVGYSPMSTKPYQTLDAGAFQTLQDQFPTFIIYGHLVVFMYLVNSLASEKELKSRIGMKMMGLKDTTYYLAWFIHFMILSLWCTVTQTLFVSIGVFKHVDGILIFLFLFLTVSAMFGIALIIVSVTNTQKAAQGFAVLYFFITLQFYTPFASNPPPDGVLYGLTLFPTVGVSCITKLLFLFNFRTDGLTAGDIDKTAFEIEGGYSLMGGLMIIAADAIFFTLLGCYLDQVIPQEFGVARPWNFLCKRKSNQ